jgi:hypothetical protein
MVDQSLPSRSLLHQPPLTRSSFDRYSFNQSPRNRFSFNPSPLNRSPFDPNISAHPFGFDHRLFPHTVLFYLNEEFLVSALCDLMRSAIRSGDGMVIVATRAHHLALAQRLSTLGVDVPAMQREGRYVAMDARETLAAVMVNGRPDFARFSELIGGAVAAARKASSALNPQGMAYDELVALLWSEEDAKTALIVEEFWQVLARTLTFSLLCAYPIQRFCSAGDEQFFHGVCAEHVTVIPPDAYPNAEAEKRIMNAAARS